MKVLSMMFALIFFASACAPRQQVAYVVPPLPPSIADKLTDCEFEFGNRQGVTWRCNSDVRLSVREALEVEKWAREKNREILYSQQQPVHISLVQFVSTSNRNTCGKYATDCYNGRYYNNDRVIREVWRPGSGWD